MNLGKSTKIYLMVFHVLLGLLAYYVPFGFAFYYVLLFFYCLFQVSRRETRAVPVAAYFIAYMVGLELLIKLSNTIIVDQFGKYAVLAIIIFSFLKTNGFSRLKPRAFLVFIILLLVSIIMVNESFSRSLDLISFYISGPICLAFCVFYFNDLKLEFNKGFINLLFLSILPIISIVTFIFLKSGGISFEDLAYGANANQSGGYGPNQVSVVLGYAIMVMFVGFLFRSSITGYFILDGFVLLLLVYRILLTFSRGGFISAIAAIILAVLFISFKSKTFVSSNKTALLSLFLGLMVVGLGWYQTNKVTGNKLTERYEGYTGDTKYTDRREFSSGRDKLVEIELDIFKENWILGVGPGMATKIRAERFVGHGEAVANHTEYTRMLAEHGLYGLAAIIILLFYPFTKLRRTRNLSSSFVLVLFGSLCLLTLAHNAHRLALPSFLYGLALVILVKDKEDDPVLRKR